MRRALAAAAAAAAALASAQHLPLPGLPYAYDALEPYIDAATMRTHHLGHMKAYTDRVNAAIGELRADPATNALAKNGLEWLLQHLDLVPEPQRGAIANHGGGYVNHELFFAQLAPARGNASSSAAAASGEGDDGDDEGAPAPGWGGDFSLTDGTHFQAAFLERFVSLPIFKELVRTAALRLFGSGWVWLELDARGAVPVLAVTTTPNQDTPLTDPRRLPLLGVDVWEHAYYLKHQNRRGDYIDALWEVIDWRGVSERFDAALRVAVDYAGAQAEAEVRASYELMRAAEAAAEEARAAEEAAERARAGSESATGSASPSPSVPVGAKGSEL